MHNVHQATEVVTWLCPACNSMPLLQGLIGRHRRWASCHILTSIHAHLEGSLPAKWRVASNAHCCCVCKACDAIRNGKPRQGQSSMQQLELPQAGKETLAVFLDRISQIAAPVSVRGRLCRRCLVGPPAVVFPVPLKAWVNERYRV